MAPPPVLLLGKSQGRRILIGYSSRGHKESYMTKRLHFHFHYALMGFPQSSDSKKSTCSAVDLGSIPGLGRSPGAGNWLSTPVFWSREFHGLYNPWGGKELDTTEQLSFSLFQYIVHTKPRAIFQNPTVPITALPLPPSPVPRFYKRSQVT